MLHIMTLGCLDVLTTPVWRMFGLDSRFYTMDDVKYVE